MRREELQQLLGELQAIFGEYVRRYTVCEESVTGVYLAVSSIPVLFTGMVHLNWENRSVMTRINQWTGLALESDIEILMIIYSCGYVIEIA